MLSDVTDRVKANRPERQRGALPVAVEKATDAVAVLDAAGNVRYYTLPWSALPVTGQGNGWTSH